MKAPNRTWNRDVFTMGGAESVTELRSRLLYMIQLASDGFNYADDEDLSANQIARFFSIMGEILDEVEHLNPDWPGTAKTNGILLDPNA